MQASVGLQIGATDKRDDDTGARRKGCDAKLGSRCDAELGASVSATEQAARLFILLLADLLLPPPPSESLGSSTIELRRDED